MGLDRKRQSLRKGVCDSLKVVQRRYALRTITEANSQAAAGPDSLSL